MKKTVILLLAFHTFGMVLKCAEISFPYLNRQNFLEGDILFFKVENIKSDNSLKITINTKEYKPFLVSVKDNTLWGALWNDNEELIFINRNIFSITFHILDKHNSSIAKKSLILKVHPYTLIKNSSSHVKSLVISSLSNNLTKNSIAREFRNERFRKELALICQDDSQIAFLLGTLRLYNNLSEKINFLLKKAFEKRIQEKGQNISEIKTFLLELKKELPVKRNEIEEFRTIFINKAKERRKALIFINLYPLYIESYLDMFQPEKAKFLYINFYKRSFPGLKNKKLLQDIAEAHTLQSCK